MLPGDYLKQYFIVLWIKGPALFGVIACQVLIEKKLGAFEAKHVDINSKILDLETQNV